MARTKVTVHFVLLDQFRGLLLSAGPSKVTSNRSTLVSDPEDSGVFFSISVNNEIGGRWIGSSCSVVWPKSCCGLALGTSDAIVGAQMAGCTGWISFPRRMRTSYPRFTIFKANLHVSTAAGKLHVHFYTNVSIAHKAEIAQAHVMGTHNSRSCSAYKAMTTPISQRERFGLSGYRNLQWIGLVACVRIWATTRTENRAPLR